MMIPSLFLRRALAADAIFSGVGAVIFRLGAGELAPLFDLPEALLLETGLFLIVYAAFVGWLGTCQSFPRILAGIVLESDAAWRLVSIALLFSGAVPLTLLGEAPIAAQAIVVGALAELQYIGLRRSSDMVAA